MGSFPGHAIPGSFFAVFALWWTIQIARRYCRSSLADGPAYRSSVTFPVGCCCPRLKECQLQLEGVMKILFTVFGMYIELSSGHVGTNNRQHGTMYFFFLLSGIADILGHYRILRPPPGMKYATLILAFVAEGILFKFHLHGRSELDVVLHVLLVYLIGATVLSLTLEMRFPCTPLAALTRAYCTFLHGTWFWQIGFILYNPMPGAVPWNHNDPDEIESVKEIFVWHLAGVLILMFAIWTAVTHVHRRYSRIQKGYGHIPADTEIRVGIRKMDY